MSSTPIPLDPESGPLWSIYHMDWNKKQVDRLCFRANNFLSRIFSCFPETLNIHHSCHEFHGDGSFNLLSIIFRRWTWFESNHQHNIYKIYHSNLEPPKWDFSPFDQRHLTSMKLVLSLYLHRSEYLTVVKVRCEACTLALSGLARYIWSRYITTASIFFRIILIKLP